MSEQALDALLRTAREPEPADEGFVGDVMRAVRNSSKGVVVRLSRPVITAVAAAALLAGGAAADLGPPPDPSSAFVGTAIVEVFTPPPLSAPAPADPEPAENPGASTLEPAEASESPGPEPEVEPTPSPSVDIDECTPSNRGIFGPLEFCYRVQVDK